MTAVYPIVVVACCALFSYSYGFIFLLRQINEEMHSAAAYYTFRLLTVYETGVSKACIVLSCKKKNPTLLIWTSKTYLPLLKLFLLSPTID